MAFFFMLLPIFTGAQDIESMLALTGYGTFNVLIWMLASRNLVLTTDCPPPAYSASAGAWSRSACCSVPSRGTLVDRFAPFSPQFLSFIALVATMAVLLSFLFVFRESDLIALTEEPEDPSSGIFGNRDARSTGLLQGMLPAELQAPKSSTPLATAAARASRTAAWKWPPPSSCRRRRPR